MALPWLARLRILCGAALEVEVVLQSDDAGVARGIIVDVRASGPRWWPRRQGEGSLSGARKFRPISDADTTEEMGEVAGHA